MGVLKTVESSKDNWSVKGIAWTHTYVVVKALYLVQWQSSLVDK